MSTPPTCPALADQARASKMEKTIALSLPIYIYTRILLTNLPSHLRLRSPTLRLFFALHIWMMYLVMVFGAFEMSYECYSHHIGNLSNALEESKGFNLEFIAGMLWISILKQDWILWDVVYNLWLAFRRAQFGELV